MRADHSSSYRLLFQQHAKSLIPAHKLAEPPLPAADVLCSLPDCLDCSPHHDFSMGGYDQSAFFEQTIKNYDISPHIFCIHKLKSRIFTTGVYLFLSFMIKTQEQIDSDYPQLVSDLQKGHQHRLREVYELYRQPFVSWAMSRYRCNKEEAIEIYQDVILAFYENVMNGKINHLSSKLQTYLFGIGKFMFLKRFNQASRHTSVGDNLADLTITDDQIPGHLIEQEERSERLQSALHQLGENCRELLIHVYYHKLSGEVIAEKLGYKNSDVVKSQKSRCMKKLRALVQGHYLPDDL